MSAEPRMHVPASHHRTPAAHDLHRHRRTSPHRSDIRPSRGSYANEYGPASPRRHLDEVPSSRYAPYADHARRPEPDHRFQESTTYQVRRRSRERSRDRSEPDGESGHTSNGRHHSSQVHHHHHHHPSHRADRDRSGNGGHADTHDKGNQDDPSPPSEAYTLSKMVKSAVLGGGLEAIRARREPGPWSGQKGQRVLLAAGAGVLVGSLRNGSLKSSGKLPYAEALATGFFAVEWYKKIARHTEHEKQAAEERRAEEKRRARAGRG